MRRLRCFWGALGWTVATGFVAIVALLIIFLKDLILNANIDFEELVKRGDLVYFAIAILGSLSIDFVSDMITEGIHRKFGTPFVVFVFVGILAFFICSFCVVAILTSLGPAQVASTKALTVGEIILVSISVLFAIATKTNTYFVKREAIGND